MHYCRVFYRKSERRSVKYGAADELWTWIEVTTGVRFHHAPHCVLTVFACHKGWLALASRSRNKRPHDLVAAAAVTVRKISNGILMGMR